MYICVEPPAYCRVNILVISAQQFWGRTSFFMDPNEPAGFSLHGGLDADTFVVIPDWATTAHIQVLSDYTFLIQRKTGDEVGERFLNKADGIVALDLKKWHFFGYGEITIYKGWTHDPEEVFRDEIPEGPEIAIVFTDSVDPDPLLNRRIYDHYQKSIRYFDAIAAEGTTSYVTVDKGGENEDATVQEIIKELGDLRDGIDQTNSDE